MPVVVTSSKPTLRLQARTACDGTIELVVDVSGGKPPFTIILSDGRRITSNSRQFIIPNVDRTTRYGIQVIDANGCIGDAEIDLSRTAIERRTRLLEQISAQEIRRTGGSDCQVEFSVQVGDGQPPFTIEAFRDINQSDTPDLRFNPGAPIVLPKGTWNLLVRDARGCFGWITVIVVIDTTRRRDIDIVTPNRNYERDHITGIGGADIVSSESYFGGEYTQGIGPTSPQHVLSPRRKPDSASTSDAVQSELPSVTLFRDPTDF